MELVSENEFIWLGRFDNIINSGGVKLNPEAIEEQLSPYINERFFISSIPHIVLGEQLVLIVESDSSKETLLDHLKSRVQLNKHSWPKKVFTLHNFKETKSGKVNRAATLSQIT